MTILNGYSGDCNANGDVTVALGESKTCVLTNSDIQPKLRLSKTVVNKYGGAATPADFQASVFDGTGSRRVAWDAFVGFDAGSYVANDTTLPGYTASKWSGDCGPDGEITLQPGDEKTCSIMNTQNPPPPPVECAPARSAAGSCTWHMRDRTRASWSAW